MADESNVKKKAPDWSAEKWASLGKMGRAKKAFTKGGGTWTPGVRKGLLAGEGMTAGQKKILEDTKRYKAMLAGPSGTTDIYRPGKWTALTGPEYHLGKEGDVDIHGYPTGWKLVEGEQDGEKGQWITPDTGSWKGRKYFKPYETPGGSGPPAPATGGTTVVTGAQPFALATLTDEMDLSNAIAGLLDQNSPLFKAAGNAAMQRMAKRGYLSNSSIAFQAVEQAILEVAMPIAKAEVDNLIDNLNKRTEWTNAERKQANDYVFAKMLKDIDNAAAYKLGLMKERSAITQQQISAYGTLAGRDDINFPSRSGKLGDIFDDMNPLARYQS